MTQLSAIPVSTYYAFPCPNCGRLPPAGSEPERCECGYSYAKTYVIPYDFPWSFDEPFWSELRTHRALRLLGKFIGKDPGRLAELKHVEYLALSRYPGFGFSLLEEFRVLRSLELDFMQLKTLDGIGQLSLTTLGLAELKALEDISALSGLPLVLLRMALCNRVKDYEPVGELERLERFDLEAKVVQSLGFLRRISSLRRVALAIDKVDSDAVAALSELSNLEWIGVRQRLLGRAGLGRLREALPACKIDVW